MQITFIINAAVYAFLSTDPNLRSVPLMKDSNVVAQDLSKVSAADWRAVFVLVGKKCDCG